MARLSRSGIRDRDAPQGLRAELAGRGGVPPLPVCQSVALAAASTTPADQPRRWRRPGVLGACAARLAPSFRGTRIRRITPCRTHVDDERPRLARGRPDLGLVPAEKQGLQSQSPTQPGGRRRRQILHPFPTDPYRSSRRRRRSHYWRRARRGETPRRVRTEYSPTRWLRRRWRPLSA